MKVTIVYDGKCPVCSRLVAAARLRKRAASLILLDARTESVTDVHGIDLSGLDFDQGFAVVVDAEVHHGAEGGRALAVLTEPSGVLYRTFQWLMVTEQRSRFWYPILRAGRYMLLRLMRVPRINQ